MRALLYGLTSALLSALAMWAGGAFLRADFLAELTRAEEAEARVVAGLMTQTLAMRSALDRRLLDVLCRREINVERLSHELDAGADESVAKRLAQLAAETMREGHAAIVETSGPRVSVLGTSPAFPNIDLDSKLLRAARKAPVVALDRAQAAHLTISCEVRDSRRWVVHTLALDALLASLRGPELRQQLAFVASDRAQADEVLGLTFERIDGGTFALAVRRALAPTAHLDLALWVVVLAAFLVAGSAGYVAGRRSDRHEHALATIETAARRVAQGDLVSAIGLRTGDRADQTFQTFDRMTKELRDMRERLAEAERENAFRDVARRIAHEIKNPLSPIRMAIETLRRARERALPDFAEIFEESTRAILEEVKRLERIVREFSEFARLPKPVPGAFDLGALVRDTLPLYLPEGIDLTVDVDPSAPLVRADREQITQVLVNLVQNALDAAKTSGSPRVFVGVLRHAQGALLCVDDNGPGIAPSDRERVFEPYYTTKDEGTGLGLSIVKRIVSDHGGQIELDQSPLGGARVRIVLPAYDESAETRGPDTAR
jgi:signal transduction histidine kinase